MKTLAYSIVAYFFGVIAISITAIPTAAVAELRPVNMFQSQMMDPVFKLDNKCSAVVVKSRASEGRKFETLLLTADHCVKGKSKGFLDDSIWEGGQLIVKREWQYKVLRHDAVNDIALIVLHDTTTRFPAAQITSEANLYAGEMVFASGFPKGLLKTVTTGMYLYETDLSRYSRKSIADMVYVTTVPIVAGNSGGGLFQRRGDQFFLIGITSRVMVGFEHNSLFSTLPAIKKILAFKDVL